MLALIAALQLITPMHTMNCLDSFEKNREEAFEFLEKSTETELWDIFLEGQARLLTPFDLKQLENTSWFKDVHTVLEIGCGNGAFLSIVQKSYPEKRYFGFDLSKSHINKATERYSNKNLLFTTGDAEKLNPNLGESFDLVVFRLTLQHLQHPMRALEHAYSYLKPGGYIYIMDSYDPGNDCSHPFTAIKGALKEVALTQRSSQKLGKRSATLDILSQLNNPQSTLGQRFTCLSSNLNHAGDLIGPSNIVMQNDQRALLTRHLLLFPALLKKRYGIDVNFQQNADELEAFLGEPKGWFCFGTHYLILRKKL